ncbi:uncharacterized protein LOC135694115 [Rhopilema esculentum]|uniref:uncharacterized protein LOC135694115 n=1 Tax=Rhopilema esculentum TaxID=499914 RepID=UPI0031DFA276
MKAFKEGKNLQNSGHLKSVLFHQISDTVKLCFIKASVVPQTHISERPYTVWVCLRNDTSLILTAECNCLAGASSSCKHVFALLHLIESEVYLGRNKSCTGKKQQWDVRISKKAEKIHLPCENSSLLIEHSSRVSESSSHATARKEYEPRSRADLSVIFGDADWEDVAEATDGTASVLQFKKTRGNKSMASSFSLSSSLRSSSSTSYPPPSIPEIASKCEDAESFISTLHLCRSPLHLEKISNMTIEQSSSEDWKNYPLGLITASVDHEALKKVDNELQISNLASANNLCAKICGYYPDFRSKSLSWGKNNEVVARKRYIKKNKGKHKSFSCTTFGLYISAAYPFLGATPDNILSCQCCGLGVLEIKCPWSSRDLDISEYINKPDSYLIKDDGSILLKPKHQYWYQVQHPMFTTGANYCDFELFLPKQSITLRILKDPAYVVDCVPKLTRFFNLIILPELFSFEIKLETECKLLLKDIVKRVSDGI